MVSITAGIVVTLGVVLVLSFSLMSRINGTAGGPAQSQATQSSAADTLAAPGGQSPSLRKTEPAERFGAGGPTAALAPKPGGVYYVAPSRDEPETAARDKRGAHMVWPAMGNISTYFHEAGPYWVGGYHQGLDIAAHWGWNVFAAWDGVVLEAGVGWNRGYGNNILIDHGNGIRTRYAHLANTLVEVGERVEYGQLIGLVGSTGASEGPHLHFEVIVDDQLRDPLQYLPEDPEREYVG